MATRTDLMNVIIEQGARCELTTKLSDRRERRIARIESVQTVYNH
jgi:hypothetical protein